MCWAQVLRLSKQTWRQIRLGDVPLSIVVAESRAHVPSCGRAQVYVVNRRCVNLQRAKTMQCMLDHYCALNSVVLNRVISSRTVGVSCGSCVMAAVESTASKF